VTQMTQINQNLTPKSFMSLSCITSPAVDKRQWHELNVFTQNTDNFEQV